MAEPEPDDFFESDSVFKLNKKNYRQFLKKQDLVMVMFYAPCKESSNDLAPEFVKVVNSNKVPNAVFAGINCVEDIDLCFRENAQATMFKVYSKGDTVGIVPDVVGVCESTLSNYLKEIADEIS